MSSPQVMTENTGTDVNAWLIAVLTLVGGAILGYIVSQRATKKTLEARVKSLLDGYYSELEINRDYLVSWLRGVLSEFDKTKTDSIIGYDGIDMLCIDSLTTELIASGKVLTKSQRKLTSNLKGKSQNIKTLTKKRYDESNIGKTGFYNINKTYTAFLILEGVECLSGISEMIKHKDKFDIDNLRGCKDISIEYLHFIGIDIDITDEKWSEIKQERASFQNGN